MYHYDLRYARIKALTTYVHGDQLVLRLYQALTQKRAQYTLNTNSAFLHDNRPYLYFSKLLRLF